MAQKPKLLARDHKTVVTVECYWHVASRMPLMRLAGRPCNTQKVRLGRSSFGRRIRRLVELGLTVKRK
jgi:hypothetical protein